MTKVSAGLLSLTLSIKRCDLISTALAIRPAPFYPSPMIPPELFNTTVQSAKRARATKAGMFLQELSRDEILERLEAVNRSFKKIAIVTGHPEIWASSLSEATIIPDEDTLGLEVGAYDLVIHSIALHHCNDPIGQVVQCGRGLQPDGLFLASCFGGQTLAELRATLSVAETNLRGGLSPRVSPMAEIRELGAVLQRAGLALPVVDSLKIPTSYRDLYHLMRDLRAMGETNIMTARVTSLTARTLFERTQKIYAEEYSDPMGRLNCTFELIFLTDGHPMQVSQRP